MGNWNWGHMGSGMGWGMGFGGLYMILVWVVIIVAIVVLAKWLFAGASPADGPRQESALDILKKRYARGEIGKEEFEQKMRELE